MLFIIIPHNIYTLSTRYKTDRRGGCLDVPPLYVLRKNVSNIALKYNYSTNLFILQYICIAAPENFRHGVIWGIITSALCITKHQNEESLFIRRVDKLDRVYPLTVLFQAKVQVRKLCRFRLSSVAHSTYDLPCIHLVALLDGHFL